MSAKVLKKWSSMAQVQKASPYGRGGGGADGEGEMDKVAVSKNNNLLNIAKILRRNMTKQEKHLWYDFLRKYPIKVYKQRIIDNFIADFYCAKVRLVIEIDGSQHLTKKGMARDEERTEILKKYGLKVIRFSNQDIDQRFYIVCCEIDREIQARIKEINDCADEVTDE